MKSTFRNSSLSSLSSLSPDKPTSCRVGVVFSLSACLYRQTNYTHTRLLPIAGKDSRGESYDKLKPATERTLHERGTNGGNISMLPTTRHHPPQPARKKASIVAAGYGEGVTRSGGSLFVASGKT